MANLAGSRPKQAGPGAWRWRAGVLAGSWVLPLAEADPPAEGGVCERLHLHATAAAIPTPKRALGHPGTHACPARPRGRRLGGSAPAPTPHPPADRSLRLAPSTAGCAGCSCGGASAGGHQQHAAPPPAAADVHLVKPAERLVPTAAQQLWLCRTATARWPRRGLKKQRTCAIHCPRQAVGQPGAPPRQHRARDSSAGGADGNGAAGAPLPRR